MKKRKGSINPLTLVLIAAVAILLTFLVVIPGLLFYFGNAMPFELHTFLTTLKVSWERLIAGIAGIFGR